MFVPPSPRQKSCEDTASGNSGTQAVGRRRDASRCIIASGFDVLLLPDNTRGYCQRFGVRYLVPRSVQISYVKEPQVGGIQGKAGKRPELPSPGYSCETAIYHLLILKAQERNPVAPQLSHGQYQSIALGCLVHRYAQCSHMKDTQGGGYSACQPKVQRLLNLSGKDRSF
jgi:hypothetical protein